jgi:hypothetical protein
MIRACFERPFKARSQETSIRIKSLVLILSRCGCTDMVMCDPSEGETASFHVGLLGINLSS